MESQERRWKAEEKMESQERRWKAEMRGDGKPREEISVV